MQERGRKVSDEAAGAVPVALVPVPKPEPPEELTPEEAVEWRRYVGRMPAEWFTAEVQPILVELCRHRCMSRKRAETLAAVGPLNDKNVIREFERLSKMHTEQSKMVMHLSTKLRLTPQSRYATSTAFNATKFTNRKPWEKSTG
jgi:hypothetical protein